MDQQLPESLALLSFRGFSHLIRDPLLVSHFGRAIAEDNEIENLLTKSSKKGERRRCQIDLNGRYGAERSDFFSAGGDDSSDRSLLYL